MGRNENENERSKSKPRSRLIVYGGGERQRRIGEDRKNLRGQGSDGRVEDSSERGHGARLKRAKGGGETWRAWN